VLPFAAKNASHVTGYFHLVPAPLKLIAHLLDLDLQAASAQPRFDRRKVA
jgi:hypothetical protein